MRFESMVGFVGVSLVSLSYPRAGASQREVREACGGKYDAALYPLADGTWVVGGALEVIVANADLETQKDLTTRDIDRAYRAIGYTTAIIAGVSMIHGIAVAIDCASNLHKPRALQAQSELAARERAPFPWSVVGYEFGMRSQSARAICEKGGGTWLTQDASATSVCEQRAPNPVVRLSSELGGITEIVLVYKPAAGRVDKVFAELETSLRGFYGSPSGQDRKPDAQPSNLEERLSRGEQPPPLRWVWPKGVVELIPAVEDEEAVVRLRYRREVGEGP
jgi:hypothetical protein